MYLKTEIFWLNLEVVLKGWGFFFVCMGPEKQMR